MDLKRASLLVFALTMTGIGLLGFLDGDFAAIWNPVPKTFFDREVLAYVCAVVAISCGAGMLVKRTAAPAALTLFVYVVIWTLAFKVPFIIRSPLVEGSYQTNGENAVLIAASWILYGSFARGRHSNSLISDRGLRACYILYGLALLAFGFSHFAYLNLTAPLVPAWLPSPDFWAYLTGAVYIATGIAIIAGIRVRAAAELAAVQITFITLLVWGPLVLAGRLSPTNLQETVESWTLTACALVLAFSVDLLPEASVSGRTGDRWSMAKSPALLSRRIGRWSSRRS